MHQPNFDLLKETVGKRFGGVCSDYGLPELSEGLFTADQLDFLQEQSESLPSDLGTLEGMILQNVNKGKVLRVGHAPTGESLFTVRIPVNKTAFVLTLAYSTEKWHLHSIEAVQTRRREIGKLLLGGLIGSAATVVIALLMASFSGGSDIAAQAKAEGYIVLTQEEYANQTGQSQVAVATQDPNAKKAGATAPGSQANGAASGKAADAGEAVVFELKEGMTTWDLTTFLLEKGLIKDQAQFNQKLSDLGLDVSLRPQEYSFKKGMTEDEVIEALKK
ncbi:hypothetical protein EV586_105304 [Tumebacillus sp. BK434]|uniref:hypothetical protein n=1 Tax=Tumebacillus sp. BK434 TaxID=2512169 RepID=UPI0010456C16|nr:hypothetical protein [Tumebacillus sp. BK434]TCP53958.1 hypothetical protein EV586_105304 [Tumebacillus sp. BK434]